MPSPPETRTPLPRIRVGGAGYRPNGAVLRHSLFVPKRVLSFRNLGELGVGHEQQLLVSLSVLKEPVGVGC